MIKGGPRMKEWINQICQGDRRKIGRAISLVESGGEEKEELLAALYPHTGNALVIGITGAPGAGKSSLVDQLTRHLRSEGKKVGVIAIDPTSPFTGGAILGDRVRMTRHALDEDVFIRSMGTRGSLGGLAQATRDAARVLDAAGYEVVIIETVGVGQSEIDIMYMADSVALVLTPGAGDVVQVFKAGIMEIADIFVVNKADLPGAQKVVREIKEMLQIAFVEKENDQKWRPPIITTISTENQGIAELWSAFQNHHIYQKSHDRWQKRRQQQIEYEVMHIIEGELRKRIQKQIKNPDIAEELQRAFRYEKLPHQIAREWIDRKMGRGGITS